jgi:hypothetical protein
MQKSVVISARVPVDIANMIKHACKTQNLTTSKYLQQIVEQPSTTPKLSRGGIVVPNNNVDIPKELKPILSAVGGIGVGTIVYKLLKTYLPDDKFTEEQKENISILCAIASGIGGLIAIDKLLERE